MAFSTELAHNFLCRDRSNAIIFIFCLLGLVPSCNFSSISTRNQHYICLIQDAQSSSAKDTWWKKNLNSNIRLVIVIQLLFCFSPTITHTNYDNNSNNSIKAECERDRKSLLSRVLHCQGVKKGQNKAYRGTYLNSGGRKDMIFLYFQKTHILYTEEIQYKTMPKLYTEDVCFFKMFLFVFVLCVLSPKKIILR